MRALTTLAAAAAVALLVAAPAAARTPALEVGVGRADITPPTGYYMMGWVRSDGVIQGQNTRLWARVIVLREGARKVALATEDLNGIPGGMMAAAANLDRKLGFSEQNVLDSASHTHAAPTSFYNFTTYNTVFMTLHSPTDFNLTGSLDPQLYAFMVRRLALAIRRANANLGPGAVGWGFSEIKNLTQNRSLEAHLYDYGIHLGYGQGKPSMDPLGPIDTIDPEVNVLRVDKLRGARHVPVGIWTTFANHGTVNKYQFTYYNEDHHGTATHLVEAAIRRAGHVPAGQDVVDAYGNTDEGDISSGLVRSGPAAAMYVGRVEASAFLAAWRQAGRHMERSPALDWRWTRMCWCGQDTPDGPVADRGAFGLSEFTGSEEGRGPLYDITRVPFEGDHLPVTPGMALPAPLSQNVPLGGPQGDKIVAPISLDVPTAVPMMALRLGNRMIVSVPGEMTEEMGRRVRAAVVGATAHAGIARAVISGLANEYSDYFTTPEEYDAQHYEGGATIYGRASADALEQVLVALSSALVAGHAAPAPYPYDPSHGISADAAPFPTGARSAKVVAQPLRVTRRLAHPVFSWRGGPRGYDRPLDRAFVQVQRQVAVRSGAGGYTHRGVEAAARRRHWTTVDSDLGLDMLWIVDANGVYRAEWEPPLDVRTGRYRFVVTANHYRLVSRAFSLAPSRALSVVRVAGGGVALALQYPAAQQHELVGDPPGDSSASLTYRPARAGAGVVTFLVGRRRVTVRSRGGVFTLRVRHGTRVAIRAGAARDGYGNRNGAALALVA